MQDHSGPRKTNKKMKTVFRSAEIAHIWAHQSAPHGRSPGNLSFNGPAILSYSTVIGRIITHEGHRAFVVDRASFSVSTSKSQGRVMSAIPDTAEVFTVQAGRRCQSLDFTPVQLVQHYVDRAVALEAELPSRYAHKRAEQYASVTHLYREALRVQKFFGLGTARLTKLLDARQAGEATAADTLKATRIKRETARLNQERKAVADRIARNVKQAEDYVAGVIPHDKIIELKGREKALADLPEDLRFRLVSIIENNNTRLLNNWRNGEDVVLPMLGDLPVMLRAEGSEMVTSKGARVPLDDAQRTFKFVSLCRAKGWHRNGEQHPIGGYQLDAVNDQGVVAGCHRVSWEEINRFAAAQNW